MTIPTKLVPGGVGPEMLKSFLEKLTKIVNTGERVVGVPLVQARVHDALGSPAVTTAANDDLALTAAGKITTATGGTSALTGIVGLLIPVPNDYHDGDPLTIRVNANIDTNINATVNSLDATVAAVIDGVAGSDICATTIKTLTTTATDYDFTVTGTTVVRGSILLVKFTIVVHDTSAAKAGLINSVKLVY